MKESLVLLKGEELKSEMLVKARQLYTDVPIGLNDANTVQWNVPLMIEQGRFATGTQEQIRYKLDPSASNQIGSNPDLVFTSQTRNVQFASRLISSALGQLEKQKYEPQVNRIDRSSKRHRQDYRKDLEFAIILNQMNVSFEKLAQELQIDPLSLPERTDELDVFINSDVALDEEIQMEYALAQTDEHFNWPALTRQIRLYLLVHGVAGIRIDTSGPKLAIRAFAPIRSRTSYSEKEDLSDITYFREVIFIPLTYLKTYYTDTFTTAEWKEIEGLAQPYDQMIGYVNNFNASYGGFEGDLFVQVLDAVWKEGCRYNNKIKVGPKGIKTFHDINGSKGTYKSESMECVMGFKWVVGTDILFDYGRQTPELRCPVTADPDDLKENDWRPCSLPVVIYRPTPLYGISVTMMDKVIPVIDELQNLTNKYNNLVKNIKPGITAINISKLADIMSNPGVRDPAAIKRIIMNYTQKGDIFYTDEEDQPGRNMKPVESFPDNTAIQLQMIWVQIINQMNLAREYAGLPQIADGQIAERTGKGTTQIALGQIEAGLSSYSEATKDIYERSHKLLCLLYQFSGTSGMYKNKPYKIDPAEAKEWIFNVTCRMVATEDDWAWLKEMVGQAWANGEGWLDPQDMLYITQNPSIKEAYRRFSYLSRLHKKEVARQQAQQQEAGSNMNLQSIQASTEQVLAEIQARSAAELKKQAEIGNQQMEQILVKMDGQAKADQKEMAHEVALAIMEIQSQQKIAKEQEKDVEVGAIK